MVPVNPVEETTVTEVDPPDPGALTTTCDWLAGTFAKNPGWMVKVTGCVLLLGLKLRSPP